MLDIVEPKDNGAASSWFNLHDAEFPGLKIPFGCGVFYRPPNTTMKLDKAEPYGVFFGYRLAPGCSRNGGYLIADL